MAEIIKKEHVIKKKAKAPVKPATTRTKAMFAIGVAIILIPFIIVAVIVLGDVMSGRKPIIKDRYNSDLDPAIKKEDLDSIEKDVVKISGVEKASVDLKTSTLRIYLDMADSTSTENVEKAAEEAYKAATSTLPANTYFKATTSSKMYDLEVHAYTVADNEASNYDYYILTRNSNTEQETGYIIEHVSVAKDPDLAAELRGENEEVEADQYSNPTDDSSESVEETEE